MVAAVLWTVTRSIKRLRRRDTPENTVRIQSRIVLFEIRPPVFLASPAAKNSMSVTDRRKVDHRKQVDQLIRAVGFRLWIARCVSVMTDALFIAAIGWLVLAVIRNGGVFPQASYAILPVGLGLCWLVGNAIRDYGRLNLPLVAARQIDDQARLDNRITTAIEFSESKGNAAADLLAIDAVASIRDVRPNDVVRMPAAQRFVLAFGTLAISGLILLASPFIVPAVAIEQQPMKIVLTEDHQNALLSILEQILNSLKQAAVENPSPELDQLIKSTEETLAKLKDGELTTSEGYVELSELQQQMLAGSQAVERSEKEAAWQKIADALQSNHSTDSIGALLQSQHFDEAIAQMEQLDSSELSVEKLSPAEVTSLSEKLSEAAETAAGASDPELAKVLKDLSAAVKDGDSEMAKQQMQDLAAESAKYQIELEQAEHLDELADQLSIGKQQMAIKSNSSGDGQMGGQGLNEETGKSKGKGGADSQKAGAKTAGNVDGPKADLEGQKKLAELQGQFGEEGNVEVKTKSTDERPDFEITRKAQAVHSAYSRQLEADLQQQDVPAGHEEIVRKYFEAIRPKADGRK